MITVSVILTIIYLFLNVLIWKKTRSLPVLIIQFLLYFYTFHGYLLVLLSNYFPDIYMRISYFFNYPYYVSINESFYLSYISYCIFSIIYLIVMFLIVPSVSKQKKQLRELRIHIWQLLILGMFLFMTNLLLWREVITGVLNTKLSAYLVFKGGSTLLEGWYPLSRLIFDMTALLFLLPLAVYLKLIPEIKIAPSYFKPLLFFITIALNVLLFFVLMSFGDKSSLMGGLLFIGCLILVNRIGLKKKLVFIFVALVTLNTISVVRHNPVNISTVDILKSSASNLLSSGETHPTFSQYAILDKDVAPYGGGRQLLYLISILVPRLISDKRPEDPYEYFANAVGIHGGTGWGLHYASDCYMTLGWAGMIIGAIILGLFYGFLYQRSCRFLSWQFIFAGSVAAFPLFIRSGIGGYKGVIYSMILAWIVYIIGFHKFVLTGNKFNAHSRNE